MLHSSYAVASGRTILTDLWTLRALPGRIGATPSCQSVPPELRILEAQSVAQTGIEGTATVTDCGTLIAWRPRRGLSTRIIALLSCRA